MYELPDPRKRKYHCFWIFAVLAGVSLCLVGAIQIFAVVLSSLFTLAAIVIPILMALDELRESNTPQEENPPKTGE